MIKSELRLIFWETTKRCNLQCIHCRAQITPHASPDELATDQVKKFIDEVVSFARPILVLSGGEPLYRSDIFEIARYAIHNGLKVALASNGTLITQEIAGQIKEAGIMRVSISLDGASEQSHDSFRRQKGAFRKALEGFNYLKESGINLQINTTVTAHNVDELPEIYSLVREIGAIAFHLFLLVPVGCGLKIAREQEISPRRYEEVLNWFYAKDQKREMELKATCAPHYYRILRQKGKEEKGRGCLAGSGVCFISYKGEVQPCGYLPLKAGNILTENFQNLWEKSDLFLTLRDASLLKGKCGVCEYRSICEGCRARAYAEKGDFLEEEPYCIYEPKR